MADFFRPLEILAGVETSTDSTPASTQHYTFADKIRFVNGRPRKLGGWVSGMLNDTAQGVARGIFSYIGPSSIQYLIGTNSRLYNLNGSTLTNITPLVTNTTSIADSLSTTYVTLGSNPVSTIIGTNTIIIAHTATHIRAGDSIVLSGATTTNGILNTQINATHIVRSQTTNAFTITVSSNATSTGSGGGGSVILKTSLITVTQVAHEFLEGDRVKILAAASTGGIPDTEINMEHIIRGVTVNTYDFECTTIATSSVSGGGGGSTTVQGQIEAGSVDATFGVGYGLGEYGVGLYGVAKTALSVTLPRIWSFDKYGTAIILSPGSQTGVYLWDGDITAAPALLTNAPTEVNYVYVASQEVITLGAAAQGNRIKTSDNLDITIWAATPQNQVYLNDVETANTFISHGNAQNVILLFTENQVYTKTYIGLPGVWQIALVDKASGIIAQNARADHNGVVYWMGNNNFYYYQGGSVGIIPSNTGTETTIKRYVFDNINFAQKSKCFAWFNPAFSEVWFHYPSATSNECDSIARLNINDFTWVPDTMNRTAAESPTISGRFPYLISSGNTIYQHERGTDDDNNPMAFSLYSPFFNSGPLTSNLKGFAPDSIQTGDISVSVIVKNYPQGVFSTKGPYTISPSTNNISYETAARFWQYQITGSVLGQDWLAGYWQEILNKGSPQ